MKKIIRILALALTLGLLLSAISAPALAYTQQKVTLELIYRDLKIVVDEVRIMPKNVNGAFVEPFLYQGTTYLPVRTVAEALDRQVEWDGDSGTVYITTKTGLWSAPPREDKITEGTNQHKPTEVIYRDIGIVIDGVPIMPCDAAGNYVEPFLIGGTTYLPIRAVAEELGKEVSWDGDTGTVSIYDPDREVINVKTAAELIKAIGPDRTILLGDGVYNLSAAALRDIENEYVYWNEMEDGWQPEVLGVKNLTLSGVSDKAAEIMLDSRMSFVLGFWACRNIRIENIKAGHSEGGLCIGGVFSFNGGAGVAIYNTDMYGCGTQGLELNCVNGVYVGNSTIYQCNYYIMSVDGCKNLLFDNCLFRDNMEFTMVNIDWSENVIFDKCEFRNNTVSQSWESFFGVADSEDIVVRNSKFINNKAKNFDPSGLVKFENCAFSGNLFPTPKQN